LRPDLLVLAELELWPNLINAANRRDVPVVVVNGRLSAASYRGYRRVRWFVSRMMRNLASIAVQNDVYAGRFLDLGAPPDRVHVTGSIKFDNATIDRGNPRTTGLADLAGIGPQHQVFLAGSTQAPEEAIALAAFEELQPRYPDLRLILVPRHPERFAEVEKLLAASSVNYLRRSQVEQGTTQPAWRVLLVDTMGELGAWWGVAKVAFVGGSLGDRGGQNMIEPAAYGAAVCFGPNTKNFRDVVSTLLQADAAVVVNGEAELNAFLDRCLRDEAFAKALGERAQSLVIHQCGATSRTIEILERFLSRAIPPQPH
jgi:3-deoxy-D-manno-octulosonic-acid transferase